MINGTSPLNQPQGIGATGGGGGGSGTVTAVSASGSQGITVSGSPITTSGTLALGLGAITPTSINASGTVAGSNLSGTNTGDQTITLTGDVAGSGTSSFAATLSNTAVTPGSYTNADITVDAKGRITAAASGSTSGVTSFNTRTGAITLTSGDVTTALGFTPGTGTVTSVTGTSGNISSTGGATPVIDLVNTAVTPASYTAANITIDSKGRITAASSNAAVLPTGGSTTQVLTKNSGTNYDVSFADPYGKATIDQFSNSPSALTLTGTDSGSGGQALGFVSGDGIGTADGGNLTLTSGSAGTQGDGGDVSITTGAGAGTGTQGDLLIDTDNLAISISGDLKINSAAGTSGQVLTSAGAGNPPVWGSPNTGTVTSVTVNGTGGNISTSGSPITTSGTISVDLVNTAVTPGSYTNADITVDAKGRITAAANGSSSSGVTSFQTSMSGLTPSTATTGVVTLAGTLGVGNGGTGQTIATAAFDALAPTTTTGDTIFFNGTDNVRLPIGTANQLLRVNSTVPGWISPGSVTVGQSDAVYVDLDTTTNAQQPILFVGTTNSYQQPNASTAVTVNASTGVLTAAAFSGDVSASDITGQVGPTQGGTGLSSYTTGDVLYASATNTLSKLAIGTTGQALTVSGGGVPTWTTLGGGSGTVTSVGVSSTDLSVSGSPVTTSGTITLDLNTTAVTPGAYTYGNFTVDSKGRLTAASSGTAPVTSVSGTASNISSTGGTTPVIDLVNTAVTPGSYTSADITIDAKGRITAAANGSGGGGTPGGSTTQIQYNNAGAFAGSAGFTFDGTNEVQIGATGTANEGKLLLNTISTRGPATIWGDATNDLGESGLFLLPAEGITGSTTGSPLNLYGGFGFTGGNGAGGLAKLIGGLGAGTGAGGNVEIQGGASGSGTPGSVIVNGNNITFTHNSNTFALQSGGAWALNGSTGTAGQVLTSGGAGADPTWATAAVGNSYTLKPVRVASTANGTLATAFANGQTVDGVTLATNDRILLKNQTTATENGVYTVNASGAPTRVTEFTTGANTLMGGVIVPVIAGTLNTGTMWQCSNAAAITIGSTSITFVRNTPQGYIKFGTEPSTLPVATGTNSIAIGSGATTSSSNTCVAIGPSAAVTFTSGVAIGASTSSSGGVAIGSSATTGSGIALGTSANAAQAGESICIGSYTSGYLNGIAIGSGANAGSTSYNRRNIVIGYTSSSIGANPIIGTSNIAIGDAIVTSSTGSSVEWISTIAIGLNANTNGTSAAVSIGYKAKTDFHGEINLCNAAFATSGDIHCSHFPMYNTTTNATATELGTSIGTTVTTPDAAGRIVLTNDSSYIFDCDIVARNTATDAESAMYNLKFGIRRGTNAASTTLVGTPVVTVIGEDTGTTGWDVSATADTTNGRPNISVTGEASKTIRWVANIRMTKVSG